MKNRLALAVATFVLLDLGTLAFSYTIARSVEMDAVAINLAGRQRMLSQRITKAALLATSAQRSAAQRAASATELSQSDQVFRQTLAAFADGGETIGGDGRRVQLERVQGRAALLVGQVHGVLAPWPQVPTDPAELERFSQFMNERNASILDAMNQLTTELERESIASVARLRVGQTLAFLLSLVNFSFILRGMVRARRAAEVASSTDALTGLLNRGGLYRELEAAIERLAGAASSLGVMMLDLNEFKAVNDTFGHAAGDATLREVARRLKDFCPPGWVCGRLGGDEFAVVCPGIAPKSLEAAAQQLSTILSGVPAAGLTVSASVGWVYAYPGQGVDEVIALADAKMYSEKKERHAARSYRGKLR
jgi:diguanylate cyclase (GGDEF)-like protein